MYDENEGVYLCFTMAKIQECKDSMKSLEYKLQELEDIVMTLKGMHNSRPCPKCGGHASLREHGKNGLPDIYCMDCGEVLLTGYAREKNLVEAWNRGASDSKKK